ncbi:sensor histidine kinase [Roseitranquillus sediminis]|uniref:sensor histidine kinase n=1 Tax=Roseitranquillus sediminis TaxID=2809051 RepID=UPI001D0C0ABE|nr:HWE histidine kinase domain-containing protein [Roseitranquillus sediminis]MBM9594651.1 PAS domain-containing protein [Roseitranquillus sediminis]
MSSSDTRYAEQIVATVSQPIVVLTGDLEVEMVNEAFCRAFAVTAEETEKRRLYDLGNGQWNIPELRRLLQEVLSEQEAVHDYRVAHDFEQLGERIMLLNARRMHRPERGDRIVLAINDITESERQRDEIEGRREFGEKLIDSVREGLLILDWDLCVRSANQPFYEQFDVTPEETEGRKIYELGNGQWNIPDLREVLERILPEEWSFDDYEVEHDFEGLGRRTMMLNGRRLDHLDLIILAIRDVTERRKHERRQQVFMAELQHRVKNILNNVRALANQTRRRNDTLDGFFDAFMSRVAALGRAQDLLLKSPEDEVELAKIVRVELEAVGAERGVSYTADGPFLCLSPHNAQALAMAVHELATNAGKYGALKSGGRVAVTWRVERNGGNVHFHWRETGVEIDELTPIRGFGAEIIKRSVPHMLDGTSEFTLHSDGAECRIVFPLPKDD